MSRKTRTVKVGLGVSSDCASTPVAARAKTESATLRILYEGPDKGKRNKLEENE